MKNLIKTTIGKTVLTLSLLVNVKMNAQDTIVMNNGEEIYGKVIEFSISDVNYKKSDSLNGPTYSKLKTEVLEVRFKNGIKENMKELMSPKKAVKKTENPDSLKETVLNLPYNNSLQKLVIRGNTFVYDGKRLSSDGLRDIASLRNDKELNILVAKSKRNKTNYLVSFVGVPIVFVGAGMMMGSMLGDGDMASSVAVVAVGSVIVDFNIYFSARGKSLKKKIAKRYNETF